jgi:porin
MNGALLRVMKVESVRTTPAKIAAFLVTFFVSTLYGSGGERSPADLLRPALADLGTQETLTGDWGGLRPALVARGVTVSGTYTGEVFGNVRGGRRTGTVYDALLQFGAEIDAGKLFGWRGATLHVSAIYPHGASLSTRLVGDLGIADDLDAYDSLRLYEAWLEQKLFADRLSLRVGFLAADTDFAVIDTASPLVHSAFGTPIALTNNFAMSAYPYSALGARLRFEPAPGWSVLFGAYDGNVAPGVFRDPSPGAAPSNEFNHWGTHLALREDEGAMLFAEIGWRTAPSNDERDAKSGPRPLVGAYKIGGVYHTDEFKDVGDVAAGRETPRGLRGNSALYLSAEQELWREPGTAGDGLASFARAAFTPSDRNLFRSSIEAGVVYSGLWQNDGRDHLACGAAVFDISDHVSDAQRRIGVPVQDLEAVVEVTYQYQINHWCTVQPDAQWIVHPGGSGLLGNALVLGMRMTVTF